jgi:cysteinyl-tRNA synthetase
VIRLLDTLSGEARPLVPLEDGHVRIYSCGPTVYGPAHVGNFRSFLFADLLVRYLRYRGLRVTWVMNITDVDDKIIKGAAANGERIDTLAERWAQAFLADADALRMTRPDVLPRATAHIPEIVALVEALLDKGHAYRTEDGSIFFRIASWPAYGRLARLDPDQLRVGERVEADEYAKDDVRDFALWKGAKPGEPSWDTAIGRGRPGWHIECSAMSMKHLGASFDVHTGGVDLIFPHHEDELAQSEAATGKPFVQTWLHCAHLRMGGAKMAKSTGNIARVSDLLASGLSARALRYTLISVHYRQALNFGDDSLAAAGAALERLDALVAALEAYREDGPDDSGLTEALTGARAAFQDALDDDLNASAALAALFDLVRDLNRRIDGRQLSSADAARALALVRELDTVLAVLPAVGRPGLVDLGSAARHPGRARDRGRGHARRPALAAVGRCRRWLRTATSRATSGPEDGRGRAVAGIEAVPGPVVDPEAAAVSMGLAGALTGAAVPAVPAVLPVPAALAVPAVRAATRSPDAGSGSGRTAPETGGRGVPAAGDE